MPPETLKLRDIETLIRIKTLTEELGLNLAGVQVVLRLMDRITHMENQINLLTEELVNLRQRTAQ